LDLDSVEKYLSTLLSVRMHGVQPAYFMN